MHIYERRLGLGRCGISKYIIQRFFMKRFFCVVLMIVLLLSSVPFAQAGADSSGAQRPPKTIAVVFDNSGSMYTDGDHMAWCRATYALEVFASMMNEGDTMLIYPMNRIELSGKTYAYDMQPLIITDPSQASVIREIKSRGTGGTPIGSVEAAINGLANASGEKWLIVLTDGTTFHSLRGDPLDKDATKRELEKYLNRTTDINTLYLGIGTGAVVPDLSIGAKHRVRGTNSSEEILRELTEMCNFMFDRYALDDVGDTIQFDVSMKKVFVFVQGRDIENVSLVDAKGNDAGTKTDARSMKYSRTSEHPDTNLQGSLVKYNDCKAGTYQLSYTGKQSSIGVYYEPDVDLKMELIDPAGNVVDGSTRPGAGTYTLKYWLVDNVTGQPTDAKELKQIVYDVEYTINGQRQQVPDSKAFGETKIDLHAQDVFDAQVTVHYLDECTMTRCGADVGWPASGIKFEDDEAEPLEIRLSGAEDIYHLSELPNAKPIRAELWYGGKKLDGEALMNPAMTQFSVVPNANIRLDAAPAGDAFLITVGYFDPTHPETTTAGDIIATVSATYKEPNHKPADAETQITFSVENDVTGLRIEVVPTSEHLAYAEVADSPIDINMAMGGDPLSQAEMDAAEWNIAISDGEHLIPFTVEKDIYQSKLIVHMNADDIKKGDYKITAAVTTKDKVGNATTSFDSADLYIRPLPRWLVLLIIGLSILLFIALMAFILTRKVLPWKINVTAIVFNLNGREIQGIHATVSYTGKLKKKGQFRFDHNPPRTAPMARGGFSATLVAADPLIKVLLHMIFKNQSLSVTFTDIRVNPCVNSLVIGGAGLSYKNGVAVQGNPTEFSVSDQQRLMISGVAMAGRNRMRISLTGTVII